MSENIDGGSAETTDTSVSSEVDAQLAEMHTAETADAPEPEKEPEEKPEVKKVVPLAALHEERTARQKLQRELAEDRRQHQEQMARINQRLEQMMTPQKQLPDREQQPVEYLDHRINELTNAQRQILEQNQQREQATARERAIEQVKNHVIGTAQEFAKQSPDLPDAVAHLNAMRTRELVALGNDPAQAATLAARELDEAAMQWAINGRNPAETAYEFAKARGYTPKAVQTPADKIAAQQKGTAAAKSLGSGGAVTGKLTAEALANMSDEDFSKLSESDWRRAMGG